MKISRKYANNIKFKRNIMGMRRRSRGSIWWFHCQMHTMTTSFDRSLRKAPFDTDSHCIMFDNGASASIMNDLKNFITTPTCIKCNVKGISGNAQATFRGRVKWQLEDNQGKLHELTIPNSYYIVAAPTRILSPQHFAQQANDHKPEPNGTGFITMSSTINDTFLSKT